MEPKFFYHRAVKKAEIMPRQSTRMGGVGNLKILLPFMRLLKKLVFGSFDYISLDSQDFNGFTRFH